MNISFTRKYVLCKFLGLVIMHSVWATAYAMVADDTLKKAQDGFYYGSYDSVKYICIPRTNSILGLHKKRHAIFVEVAIEVPSTPALYLAGLDQIERKTLIAKTVNLAKKHKCSSHCNKVSNSGEECEILQ